jgi:hypothetical protein
MAKWADYLISHVNKNSSGVITHVVLHTDNDESVDGGVVKTEAEVVALLKRGYTVKTIMWQYPKWYEGAVVSYIKGVNYDFLRTDRDKTAKDNLDNMIPMYN